MVLAAGLLETCLRFRDLEHKISQVGNGEQLVIQYRILGVNLFYEGPVLRHDLHVVGIDPEVASLD